MERKAFSLVELLVVIGIIGVLIALLMLAVQVVAQESRRIDIWWQSRMWMLGFDSPEQKSTQLLNATVVATSARAGAPHWRFREHCGFIGVRQHLSAELQRLCSSGLASASTCSTSATTASARRVPRARRCPVPSTAS